jgi:hypothetical protein
VAEEEEFVVSAPIRLSRANGEEDQSDDSAKEKSNTDKPELETPDASPRKREKKSEKSSKHHSRRTSDAVERRGSVKDVTDKKRHDRRGSSRPDSEESDDKAQQQPPPAATPQPQIVEPEKETKPIKTRSKSEKARTTIESEESRDKEKDNNSNNKESKEKDTTSSSTKEKSQRSKREDSLGDRMVKQESMSKLLDHKIDRTLRLSKEDLPSKAEERKDGDLTDRDKQDGRHTDRDSGRHTDREKREERRSKTRSSSHRASDIVASNAVEAAKDAAEKEKREKKEDKSPRDLHTSSSSKKRVTLKLTKSAECYVCKKEMGVGETAVDEGSNRYLHEDCVKATKTPGSHTKQNSKGSSATASSSHVKVSSEDSEKPKT